MKLVLVKYNAGNIQSVIFALNRLGVEPMLTSDTSEIMSADKIIFPGVGEASSTMHFLRQHKLDEVIKNATQPFLGVCLGMQLMCSHSEEGDVDCLGIFQNKVKRFTAVPNSGYKIPHMGWNSISKLVSPLFREVDEQSYVYFVHSYYAELSNYTAAVCEYIEPFSAALQKDNFYAVQFHPEKSVETGEKVLKNFLEL